MKLFFSILLFFFAIAFVIVSCIGVTKMYDAGHYFSGSITFIVTVIVGIVLFLISDDMARS